VLAAAGLTFGVVGTVAEIVDDPQALEAGFLRPVAPAISTDRFVFAGLPRLSSYRGFLQFTRRTGNFKHSLKNSCKSLSTYV